MSPGALVTSLVANRGLIWEMTKREVIGRYRGSVFGILWSFFNPLLLLTVYTFVFNVVFKARWSAGSTSKTEFAMVLFVGLIVHGLFADCATRAPRLVVENINYVKKVVFPLETLAWTAMGSALFHAGISVVVLLGLYSAVNFSLQWTAILFPVILLPFVLLTMGCVWLLASLGVFLRDIGQAMGIITSIMMFLSPVFYPASNLQEPYRMLLHLNPLTLIIEEGRDVLIWGRLPDWTSLGVYYVIAIVTAWLGFAWFQKTRRGFADVL